MKRKITGKKIKVALFTDVLRENLDGVTHTLYNIIERIPEDRFEYLFITPYPPSEKINLPFPVYTCTYIKFPLYDAYPFALPFFNPGLKKVLDSFSPDIIHFTGPTLLGRYAVKYAESRNIPLTSTYHTHFLAYVDYYFKNIPGLRRLMKYLANRIMKFHYNRCDITFVPTSPIRDELIKSGIDEKRLLIWGRGIDLHEFNPKFRNDSYINKLSGKGIKRILFVSRLVWEKEVNTLIGIYEQLAKTRNDVRMIITGDGPEKEYMEKKMPGAIFTGKLTNRELARVYASCDIFVFPSITETFGNVVLEAMASGLAVVAADKGGPKGIIKDGLTGFLAEPKNPDDFCIKISRLLDDQQLFSRIRKNAVKYAMSQKWDNLCVKMFDTYEKIIEARKNEEQEVLDEVAV
ncbi:MAG: glycosyltransferase family 1 protein [Spirochaetes bacterium]|jgi:glycosyltransferase involved in cell wall biosynthesis|nr:glycosyltransferase family 1 protein [Spirochaetota bacterium]